MRALRHQKSLRQEDLDAWDLAWKTVQKIEYAASDPKISTLLKLCRAFDLGLIEFLAPIVLPETPSHRRATGRQRVRIATTRRR